MAQSKDSMSEEWFAPQATPRHQSAEEIISVAVKEFSPIRIFAAFSSGNDSLVSTHIAMANGAHEVFNANTTIGIPEAREHLYRVCDRFKWPLRVKVPPDLDFEDMVLKEGFPGPGAHIYPYSWLKERAIRQLVAETKRQEHDRIMLITGVRRSESTKRMGYVEPIHRDGCLVWVAPIFDWTDADKETYIDTHDLPTSPVTERLGISGECLCGAFARPGERRRIAKFYPHVEAEFLRLEAMAREIKQPYCEWGNGRRVDPDQIPMFMPFCVDCH